MKKRIPVIILTLCLLLSPVVSHAEKAGFHPDIYDGPVTFSQSLYEDGETADEPRVTFEYAPDEQKSPSPAPETGCRAVYLADPVSGKVFYEKNAHEKMYPASTTKILTALLVLENCDPEDIVTVSQRAIDLRPAGYQSANLRAGEKLSVYTLLQALLIPSANEAAYALAEHVSGSIEAFAALCNERASELGCENLHFVNPNGVHSEDHYCTAYDLYLIAKECRKYDVFNEITAAQSFTVPATDIHPAADRKYTNTNELLLPSSKYYRSYCSGIKTGHTAAAGECLVSSSCNDNLNLICVVIGGKIYGGVNERFSDTVKLLDYVYDNYSYKKIAAGGKLIRQVNIDNAVSDIILQADITTVAPAETGEDNVETEIDLPGEFKAPIQKNQVLGRITYKVDGLNYSLNLVAGNEIIKKPYWLYNSLVSLAAALAVIIIAISVRRAKIKKARRAYALKHRQAR